MTTTAQLEIKPTWRGWIHAATTPAAIALGVVLICLAASGVGKAAAAVYLGTSVLLFGNSAVYHRGKWTPKVKAVLRRIDHANIFLLIAGSYTPITLLALPQPKSAILLSVIWGGAILGVAFRVFWLSAPRWTYVVLYLLLGWAAALFMGDFFTADAPMMILILVGGGFYSLGALAYATKRPNPFPGRFGFHEVFHACTLLAFLSQWTGILLVSLHPVY